MMPTHQPRLHIIIYSPFPHYRGGRENWLFNVLRELDRRGLDATVYAYKSNLSRAYELEVFNALELISVPTLRYWHKLFLAGNVLTLRTLFLLDAFVVFPYLVRKRLEGRLQDGDVVLLGQPAQALVEFVMVRTAGILHA